MSILIPTLDRFIEAAGRAQKRRIIAPAERKLQGALSRAFRAQGRLFLRGFGKLRGKFSEAVAESDWVGIFSHATAETYDLFYAPIQGAAGAMLVQGAKTLITDLGVDVAFRLSNPRAVAYLEAHGFDLISGIDATTRGNIATVITQATESGWSYGKTATEIRSLYGDMSRKRAMLIATQESGMAYEAGNSIVAADLQDAGLKMEKAWSTVGDNRVSQEICAPNQAQGWIPFDEAFQSGHMQPLGHVRCRCTALYRRKP